MGTIWGYSLDTLFAKGGPVMWPLLGSSILVLALALDRALAHWRTHLKYAPFLQWLQHTIREGAFDKAKSKCLHMRSPIARTAGAYLEHRDSDALLRASIVQREGAAALEVMERHQRGLAVLASLSTLMGLLGTVTGLVTCFQRIAFSTGQVRPEELATGIWEALITTIFGLSIAIPATALYHYFDHRTDLAARRMGFMVAYLDEWIGKATPAMSTAQPAVKED